MTDYQKLYDGISRAAWGYFFVYFDLNIVDILPDFVGYILFLYAINLLQGSRYLRRFLPKCRLNRR